VVAVLAGVEDLEYGAEGGVGEDGPDGGLVIGSISARPPSGVT
jgi:hypothetical protein